MFYKGEGVKVEIKPPLSAPDGQEIEIVECLKLKKKNKVTKKGYQLHLSLDDQLHLFVKIVVSILFYSREV